MGSTRGSAALTRCRGPSAAALVCAVSWVSIAGLPCLRAGDAWCIAALALPLLGILVAALLVWRQPQSPERASFMVSTQLSPWGPSPERRTWGMERRQALQPRGERVTLHRGVFPLLLVRQIFAASTLNKAMLKASGSSQGFP